MQMRLDKLLAHCGVGSRKEVKQLIRKGHIQVNGHIIKKDDYQVNELEDTILLDNEEIHYRRFVYLMLNKPQGYISATMDQVHPTVIDLIAGYEQYELFPVGRLDIDTVGLLLLTNDGQLAHHILSPKKHISKIYYAKINAKVNEQDVAAFKQGLDLGDFQAMPANLKILSANDEESEVEIEIFEGKFHQVKRMFEAVGKTVIYLKRIKMKHLILDPQLEEGQYRELTNDELENLMKIDVK